jgi:surface polysaccharide O-acyltransferase-like enzyme
MESQKGIAQTITKPVSPLRESGVEVLRILFMVFIVGSHFFLHGFGLSNSNLSVLNISGVVFSFLSHIAVCGFLIISGYFLRDSHFKIRHLLRLLIELFVFGMAWFAGLLVSGAQPFSWTFLLASIFPSFYQYWFVACYLVLYLFFPFINLGLKHLSFRPYIVLLSVLFFFATIVPTVFYRSLLIEKMGFVLLFVFCFALGNFLSRFSLSINRYWRINAILCFLFGLALSIGILVWNQERGSNYDALYFIRDCSPFVTGAAVGLFLEFKHFKWRSFRWISFLSSGVFGAYLLHENSFAFSTIYQSIFHVSDFADPSVLSLGYCVFFILCVMIGGLATSLFIHCAIENPLFALFRPGLDALQNKIDRLYLPVSDEPVSGGSK